MNHLRDILEMLVRAASGQPVPADAWPTADHPAWPAIDNLASFHRLTPLIAFRIKEGTCPAPPAPVAAAWANILQHARLNHLLALGDLIAFQEALTRAGIPACPLKGPRLAEDVYPDPGLRVSDDLDLLVAPASREDAFGLLRSLGYYTREHSLPFVARYHFHTTWWHRTSGRCIELHTRPADRSVLPGSPGQGPIDFVTALRDDPAAMAVYLAVHLDKHGWLNRYVPTSSASALVALHPWSGNRLIWLIDLVLYLRRHRIDRPVLEGTAASWRCENALRNSVRIATALGLMDASTGYDHESVTPAPWPLRSLLRRLDRDLEALDTARLAPPWWLRPGRITGFRPVRIAAMFGMR